MSFLHTHPYAPFLFPGVTKVIVGTLPPPRFTTRDLKPDDVDFCYGSRNGMLWPILDRIFNLNLTYENTPTAVQIRRDFLVSQKIGVCDIVASAKRDKIDASDLGMQDVVLRNLLKYIHRYPTINTLLFMGGNSKNGPEYFFRKQLKSNEIPYTVLSNEVPRIHEFVLSKLGTTSIEKRKVKTVSLTAPSGAANRAIGSMEAYKKLKDENPDFNTLDFRVLQYASFF